jgi:hypothetical protein
MAVSLRPDAGIFGPMGNQCSCGSPSGFVADRFPRVWVVVGADTVRALVWSTAAILVASHLARFPSVMVILCLATAAGTLFQPAYASLMAEVYVADIRTAANALTEMAHRMANVFGSLISGAVTSLGRASWAFGIDAVTFYVSAVSLLTLRSVESASSRATAPTATGHTFFRTLYAAWSAVRDDEWLLRVIVASSLISVLNTMAVSIALPTFILGQRHWAPLAYAGALAGVGAGAFGVSAVVGLRKTWGDVPWLMFAGTALMGFGFFGMSMASWPAGPTIWGVVGGAGLGFFSVLWRSAFQERVSREVFGRVAALDRVSSILLFPAGYVAAAGSATAFGAGRTLAACGIGIAIVSLGAARLSTR